MERHLRALPLIFLFFTGCYFDLIAQKEDKSNKAKQHITGFSYNNYDKHKINDWTIRGEKSTINSDRSLNLIKPHLIVKNENNPISVTGDRGGWDPKSEEVSIFNNVVASSDRMGVVTTNYINYSSPTKNFKTDKEVHFRHRNISVDGKGIFGNTSEGDLQILEDVHVRIFILRTLPQEE